MFTILLATATALPVAPAPRSKAETAAQAVSRSLPLLAAAASGHAEQKTCFACHNQVFPMMAFAAAKGRDLDLPKTLLKEQAEHVATFIASNREKFRKGEGTGGQVDTAGYAMLALELAEHPADENTAAVVEYFLKTQPDRDHWRTVSHRPPSEASDFTPTYLAMRAIRKWGTKDQAERGAKRIDSARGWLLKATPKDTEDRVFRLLGLKEGGAEAAAIAAAADDLLRTQRSNGGWSQLPDMEPDAYATATALVALHRAGGLAVSAPAFSRGIAFLVRTQRTDGSWHIVSRSKPFQPYYESGFPHGKDQFISAAASGWATTALILSEGSKR